MSDTESSATNSDEPIEYANRYIFENVFSYNAGQQCPSCDANNSDNTCAENLRRYGVTIIKNAVDLEILQNAKEDYQNILTNSVVPYVAIQPSSVNQDIHNNVDYDHILDNKRWNLIMPYKNNIKKLIDNSWKNTKEILKQDYGENPTLIEVAALITEPISPAQKWHRDCPSETFKDNENILSTAVSLKDQSDTHGVLHVQLGNFESCNTNNDFAKCGTDEGDLVIWDSKVCHRGGEHDGVGPGGFARRETLYYTHMYNMEEIPDCSTFAIDNRAELETLQ